MQTKVARAATSRSPVKKTLRLFCLPYAGGSARIFRDWSRHLPKFVELCPLELPGRGTRNHEVPIGELEPLMQDLLGQVLRRLDKQFAILGYDYGALLGFELAHRLEQRYGVHPKHLFVAAMRAPAWSRPVNSVARLSDKRLRELLRRGGGDDRSLLKRDHLMAVTIRVLRADFSVSDGYECKPGAMLNAPITAFCGRADPRISRESVRAWDECTEGEFRWHALPGDHFFLRSSRDIMLQILSSELSRDAPIPLPIEALA